jgi:exodeoxyribonuclease III
LGNQCQYRRRFLVAQALQVAGLTVHHLGMKIATLNINNVNRRLANLLGWLRRARPDVACLQELKATDREFPIAAIKKAGYDAVWRGQKSWNGIAILGRDCEPVLTRTELPDNAADTQSRYIEAAVKGVLIATLYAPNGNPQPGPKFKYKLAWMKRLLVHAAELYALDAPVVLEPPCLQSMHFAAAILSLSATSSQSH